ncbi:hypothetical protein DSO57_1000806 [Entomophthora muscae]|uniref:Uncharacterized protein n=1 Tax=Entomophthora muscae TaxID=34485 RepID=A0ACC2U7W3_9FUNG|nr:hypothetical protein DSO57_1000806 [Entomophthora muscae]
MVLDFKTGEQARINQLVQGELEQYWGSWGNWGGKLGRGSFDLNLKRLFLKIETLAPAAPSQTARERLLLQFGPKKKPIRLLTSFEFEAKASSKAPSTVVTSDWLQETILCSGKGDYPVSERTQVQSPYWNKRWHPGLNKGPGRNSKLGEEFLGPRRRIEKASLTELSVQDAENFPEVPTPDTGGLLGEIHKFLHESYSKLPQSPGGGTELEEAPNSQIDKQKDLKSSHPEAASGKPPVPSATLLSETPDANPPKPRKPNQEVNPGSVV